MKKAFSLPMLVYSFLTVSANIVYTDSKTSNISTDIYPREYFKNIIIPDTQIEKKLFKLKDMQDNEIRVTLGDGKLKIINFWALWCAPCKREMRSLNRIKELIDNDSLEVIAVAAGRNNVEKINTFFYENDLSLLRSLRDPYGKLSSTLGILGLPTTLIIDPTGNEIGRIIGDIDWSSEKSINFFQLVIDKFNL